LQQAGVACESIGKLHYRDADDPVGFDALHLPMMVQDGIGMVWASLRGEDERIIAEKRMLGDKIGSGESTYTRYDAEVTQSAVDWLAQAKDRPDGWCLFIGLVAPHFPLVCPKPFYDIYDSMELPPARLHPGDGYVRHPWVEKQDAMFSVEKEFVDEDERRRAFVAYYGLVSWLDHNVGKITQAVEDAGLWDNTALIYTSDHGDNVGARGLWGKSNMYEESAAVPMMMAHPDLSCAECHTPVSLIDVAATIPAHFGIKPSPANRGRPLDVIAGEPQDMERVVFSEYHAAGAVSAAFMIRKGRYKLIHYVGFDDELFDLETDPGEEVNLAGEASHAEVLEDMHRALREICDPDEVDARAHADQRALVESFGGIEKARHLGPKGATPTPADVPSDGG